MQSNEKPDRVIISLGVNLVHSSATNAIPAPPVRKKNIIAIIDSIMVKILN